jgi:DhnA family fructose-bisphosphate aldolase class Ia
MTVITIDVTEQLLLPPIDVTITFTYPDEVELGADIIKADPTADIDVYRKVIETAGRIPVLVRGGGKVSDEVILERTEALMKQGAAGIVYGRNIIQHQNPAAITRALMAVVHENSSAGDAMKFLK